MTVLRGQSRGERPTHLTYRSTRSRSSCLGGSKSVFEQGLCLSLENPWMSPCDTPKSVKYETHLHRKKRSFTPWKCLLRIQAGFRVDYSGRVSLHIWSCLDLSTTFKPLPFQHYLIHNKLINK